MIDPDSRNKVKSPVSASLSSLLQVADLCKDYGDRPILRNLSFSLVGGERVALMGPSGSGKSTLLNCLGGIDRPDQGSILLGEQDLVQLAPEALAAVRRSQIAHVFQFFHLLPTLTASENVEFPLQLIGISPSERRERVDTLIRAVGLDHRALALPSQLSGGEMQRVAIARALAPSPRLILADEPTGNLDSRTGNQILDLLEKLCDETGVTLFLVTHDPAITRICSRTLHLLDGLLREESRT